MNILITGGSGFIGSHLSEALLARGDNVTVIDDLSTGDIRNIAHLQDKANFTFVQDSVCNIPAMGPLVERCDIIFHLAAAVGVQLIVDRPVHTIETNIHGSEVALELADKYKKKIFVASTSEVYGKNTKVPFNEDDDTIIGSTRFTRWSYACSKMIDEFLALAYHDQFGLETIVCRFFNTIGPRQRGNYGMVVPRFVQKALNNENIQIYGDGNQSRCFSNVSDIVGALIKLIDCPQAVGQVINVGTTQQITINELAQKIIELCNSKSEIEHISYEEAYGRPFDDMMVRMPDLGKIRKLINYEPKVSLEGTLKEIIDFEINEK